MKAMILAAGRGERLKPLTDTTPKSLIEVNNQPLIVHHINNLKKSGITDIIINVAYLGSKVERYLGDGQAFGVNLIYSREQAGGLETGGGIFNALPLLGSQAFITVNADIYFPFPFETLLQPKAALAHLILVDNPPHNPKGDFSIDNGYLSNRQDLIRHTFSGVACYHPSFFSQCEAGRYSVTPLVQAQAEALNITASLSHDVWHDIGTEERLTYARSNVRVINQ